MGSARELTCPAIGGIGAQLSHFFDRLAAIPMPEHMVALIDELERTYAFEGVEDEPAESLKA